ncbi:nucleoside triphosphate pyrophosphohydrolase [Clostridium fermenticellae]|uniref:Nucleoside triphosphate pyrophosphohydrolase n=1 Tax=Clostridium fermenticellae TaxID=2068654 RepID=A0A386H697_9CLOT|nr:nucleoside triphosphate pyrophosphohydrolase [Clostridium fermenticellae]AYD41281.1 nucleoside triphosphate pyrophosphohydrolase [Clostridium fermenticellae]
MIKVVGLGPGSKESITLGVLEVLKNSSKIYLRTSKHPTIKYLKEYGIEFETYDDIYEREEKFEGVYKSIAEDLVKRESDFTNIVYAVPGHPLIAEKSVNMLIELCNERSIDIDILPAVSFIDALVERLKIDPIDGLKIIDAFDIKNQILDKRVATVVTQVYDKLIASEVKLYLMKYYDDDTEIYFVRAAGVKGEEVIRKIPLYELDRQDDIDYLTSIYIPRELDRVKDFYDLLDITEILRSEKGCPWDREQTHESLKRYLIEESYEVLEAIDDKNIEELVEELGDVLFQVVFHAQIGSEDGLFDIGDVLKNLCTKMINRHPHVFGNTHADTSDEVIENWDEIKRKEQELKSYTDELKHVPKNLPALMRAEKVQRKASKVGFDWDKVDDVFDKVMEEYYEVKDAYKGKERAKILEEIGDLIFASVNVSRFLDIDPEFALNYTIEKFINRFAYIEANSRSRNIDMKDMTLDEMDQLWEKSKNK